MTAAANTGLILGNPKLTAQLRRSIRSMVQKACTFTPAEQAYAVEEFVSRMLHEGVYVGINGQLQLPELTLH